MAEFYWVQQGIVSNYSTIQKDQLHKLGSYLKDTREEQGKSIEEISLQTYIRPQLIMRIESGDDADLPQPIFVQGFIRRYADALGLDGMKLSRQFPVHSIPDTPRPTPRPALPLVPLATQPPVAKPTPEPANSPAISSVPSANDTLNQPANPISNGLENGLEPAPRIESIESTDTARESVLTGDVPPPAGQPAINGTVGEPNRHGAASSVPSPLPASPSISASNGWEAPRSQPLEPTSNKTPYILAGVLAALVVGAIALLTNLPGGNEPQRAEEPAPTAEVVEPLPEPEPEPEPEPGSPTTASTAPVAVSVSLTDDSWMRIALDGDVVFADIMTAGAEEVYEAQESISIRAGNAGAVTLSHNGSPPTVAGAPGAIEDLYFTPEAAPDETDAGEAAE
ncbi:MAG: RodZ domain-containing protein [Cyanobacteria bacterium P01_A01_bin.114]